MTALAPYARGPRDGVVALAAGNVACEIRLERIDRARNVAAYAIALANDGDTDVFCRLYALDRYDGETDLATLAIARHSIARSSVIIPLRSGYGDDLVHVEVVGPDLHLRSQTAAPRERARPKGASVRVLVGLLASLSAVIGLVSFPPASLLPALWLAAPLHVAVGAINVPYGLDRSTVARYRAIAPDGSVIDRGELERREGTIAVNVPKRFAGRSIDLELEARDTFGSSVKRVRIAIDAEPVLAKRALAAPVARIASLTAHRETLDGTSAVLASYLAVADRGEIRISDASGLTIARAAFTRAGTNRIVIPSADRTQTVRAELHVVRGSSQAVASVDLSPEAAATATPLPATTPNAVAALSEPPLAASAIGGEASDTAPQVGDPFAISGRVFGGTRFDVTIKRRLPGMHVALQDEMGTTLDEDDVRGAAASVLLKAPAVRAISTLYVACTFTRGSAEETIVRSLRVYPHR